MALKQTYRKGKDAAAHDNDSLFGLLSSYKIYNTYFRVLVSEEQDRIVIQVTDNPKNWGNIPADNYRDYKLLSRLDMGINRLSVKYVSPQHLIVFFGSILGSRLPTNKVTIINNLDKDGFFILETSLKYRQSIISGLKKLINLPPQKKYEILEKFIVDASKG
ncbi:MAG: hypothetical protein KBA61_00630 [Spirochaetes bacterium]|jgi:hypothetical protein|nr:hypothetical protein [Spirochaetota bacterium]